MGAAFRNRAALFAGPNHLRPGLRTGYAEGGRTSQGLERFFLRVGYSLVTGMPAYLYIKPVAGIPATRLYPTLRKNRSGPCEVLPTSA